MNYYLSPYERDNEDLPQMINLNSIFYVCISFIYYVKLRQPSVTELIWDIPIFLFLSLHNMV